MRNLLGEVSFAIAQRKLNPHEISTFGHDRRRLDFCHCRNSFDAWLGLDAHTFWSTRSEVPVSHSLIAINFVLSLFVRPQKKRCQGQVQMSDGQPSRNVRFCLSGSILDFFLDLQLKGSRESGRPVLLAGTCPDLACYGATL